LRRLICFLPLILSQTLAVASSDQYVGSKACAACHTSIYEAYRRTPMARTLAHPASGGPRQPITVYNKAADRYYQVVQDETGLHQSEYQIDADGKTVFRIDQKIEYAVGSGSNGRTYIVRRDDSLFEAPLSFYTRTKSWGLSPGYDQNDQGFSRPILPVCMSCHGGPSPGIPQDDLGVRCESCHGPGRAHVKSVGKGAIVNPGKLSPALAEDICMRCHQDGDARILQPGKADSDFLPGTPLSQTVAIFKLPPQRGSGENTDLLEHVFSLRLSECYLKSGGKLSCLTCHDPHTNRPDTSFRTKCLQCHEVKACSLAPERRGAADSCVMCHMPKRQVQGISHSALTQHRIVRKPGQPYPEAAFHLGSPELFGLIYLNGSRRDLPDVTLIQAYAQLLMRQPALEAPYLALLEKLRSAGERNAFVLAALGRKALRESDPNAIAYLKQAIEGNVISPIPFQDLDEALWRDGQREESVRTLQRGLERFPFAAALHKLLASRYISLKQYASARKTIVHYLELFPEDTFMREMLRKFDTAADANSSVKN
jgi:hypothetical protein